MVDIAKLQKKRNTLLLAPKRKLTSVVKPTTVDTTPVASTPYAPSSSVNTSAGSGTSVIAPTTTTTSTTAPSAPSTGSPPIAPKSNPTTDLIKKAAITGGAALVGKVILDAINKPATTSPAVKPPPAPATKPAAPVTKPPAAPVVKPPTSVVIPPALQKEQDAQVKAAVAAKNAADHNALAGSFDQGTKVGLPYNTIPNNTPAQAGTVRDSDFTYRVRSEGEDAGTDVGLDYNTIPDSTPSEASTIDESMFDDPLDQGEKLGLEENVIPDNTPSEASTIDESMFDDPTGSAEPSPVLVQDDDGNLFLANADGSYTPADADGNPMGDPIFAGGDEAGVGTEYADNSYGDTAIDTGGGGYEAMDEAGNLFFVGDDGSVTALPSPEEEVTNYVDPSAGYEAYDEAGNLYFVGDDGSFTLLESAYEEPAYEEPYYEEPYYESPEYDFASQPYYEEPYYEEPYFEPYYEEPNYGYTYDYDPSYYEEPYFDNYESDTSYLDDYKRGGQVQQMKKGGLPHFYTGGGAYDYLDKATYPEEGYTAEASPVDIGGNPAGTDFDNVIPRSTDFNPASIADMEYLYSEDPTNNDNSAYYTSPNNDNSAYYTSTSNVEENVFDPYDLTADEQLMEDEEGRKFAVDSNGNYRMVEDSRFPTNADPTRPTYPTTTPKVNNNTSNYTGVPKTSSSRSFNYKDLFSADNIKKLAGAGLGAAGLMTLYNSFKDKESTYKPATYTPPAIPARTTTFGMGPAKTVTPTMGALQTMTPSQQEELYTNLGVAGYDREHEDPVEDTVEDTAVDQPMADGGYAQQQTSQPNPSYFTYGMPQDPLEVLGVRQPQEKSQGGGLQMRQGGLPHPTAGVPIVQGRQDYRQGAAVSGEGDGQSDDIPAMLADGEYVFDSDVVAALGNGSNKAGAEVLDRFREEIRAHKRSAPIDKIPPKAKSPLAYMKEAT